MTPSLRSLAGRIRRSADARRLARIHRRHERDHASEYERVRDVVASYHEVGGVDHPYYAYSLVELDRLLAEHRPASILELGSGGTTVVMARYARKVGARFVSLEEDEKWTEATSELLGSLVAHVELRTVPRVLRETEQGKEVRYDDSPDEAFDLVLVDGPSLVFGPVHEHLAICSNVFDLPARPRVIVVDKRRPTVEAIVGRWGSGYDVRPSAVITGRIGPGYDYFSVFTLKESP